MRLFASILEGVTKMKEQNEKPKRNLHTIVVDALGNYSYPIFMTKILKKDIADKVCRDFSEEYYPSELVPTDEDVQLAASIVESNDNVSGVLMIDGEIEQVDYESTTADEYNEEYLQDAADDMQEQTDIHYSKKEIKGSRDGHWESKQ